MRLKIYVFSPSGRHNRFLRFLSCSLLRRSYVKSIERLVIYYPLNVVAERGYPTLSEDRTFDPSTTAMAQQQMTAEQHALINLQQELETSRNQVLAVTQRLDALSASHQLLNNEADRLFREKAAEIQALEQRLSATLFTQKFDLLDLKTMMPEHFAGKRNEAWKPWQRKFKAYCNGKAQGFRSALEWAELQQQPLNGNFHGCPWNKAQKADAKLHDFLCSLLEERPA